MKPGFKFAEYEYKGVPVRFGIGPRDLENNTIEVARRDTLSKEMMPMEGIEDKIVVLLEEIQQNLFDRAKKFRADKSRNVDNWEEFKVEIEKGGFLYAHWDGSPETEQKIKEETKATIRAIPLDAKEEDGLCVYSGKPSNKRVVFARAY